MDTTVKRGDIFYADLSPVVGSEQGGTRPVLIVQNDTGNKHSPTVIAAAITSQTNKAKLPTHIELSGRSVGLTKDSVVLLEQIRTIDKRRLREHRRANHSQSDRPIANPAECDTHDARLSFRLKRGLYSFLEAVRCLPVCE